MRNGKGAGRNQEVGVRLGLAESGRSGHVIKQAARDCAS